MWSLHCAARLRFDLGSWWGRARRAAPGCSPTSHRLPDHKPAILRRERRLLFIITVTIMLAHFQSSYQRMEQSLQRLADSIAAYNPSTTAADELVAADDALSEDLSRLVQHQRNVTRIEELRRLAQERDERIRKHLEAVARLRKELAAIPPADTNPAARSVSVDELLSYARYISPTTVPPTRPRRAPSAEPKPETAGVELTNGTSTTPPAPSAAPHEDDHPPYTRSNTVTESAVPDDQRRWLDTRADELAFEPWPNGFQIGSGALGAIQKMVEDGRELGSVLSAQEREAEERRRQEERDREEAEEEAARRRRASMFDMGGAGARKGTEDGADTFDPDA